MFSKANSTKAALAADVSANSWIAPLRAALGATAILAVLCCGVYPALVWGVAQAMFPFAANGSLIQRDGSPAKRDQDAVGSALIGQTFASPGYFHPRPSAAGAGYDAGASSGSNLGPTAKKLNEGLADDPATPEVNESYDGIPQLIAAYRATNLLSDDTPVPADAVTRSASGLDPHISPANALLQAQRVAGARKMDLGEVTELIARHTAARSIMGLLGEPGVNVVTLNLALDQRKGGR